MNNSTIRAVVISGALAVIGIMIVQGFWFWNAYNHVQRTFDEKVHIALNHVAKQISELTQVQLPTYDLISRVAQNYYVVNVRDAIDPENLEYFLVKEFEAVNIHTDFEYGIYDCESDQVVYGDYVHMPAPSEKNQRPDIDPLPTYSEYIYYFGVRFPNLYGFVLQEQWISVLLSLLLILAIGFFIFSTSVILKQKRLSELQKDFINNMTHEFKTPLSSIQIGANTLLNDPQLEQNQRFFQYLTIIKNQAERLTEQVERVLQIAKINKRGFNLNKQECDLGNIIQEVIASFSQKIKQRNGKILFINSSLNTLIKADRHHLKNILNNLIDNALKYSKDAPEITITLSRKNQKTLLSVKDKGIGMSQEQLKNIFKQFYRVPTGNIHDTKGFGLGLYYVHEISKAHQWQIQVESKPQEGTIVKITF